MDKSKLMPRIEQAAVDGTVLKEYQMIERVIDAETGNMMQQELTGGKCPMCGQPWRKVETRNLFGEFTFYDPGCKCFPRCPECGKSFHRFAMPNTDAEKYTCRSCGWAYEKRWALICCKCGLGFAWKGHGVRPRLCGTCSGKGKKQQEKVAKYGE